ncbi:MAG: TolC family protein [Fibrobacter sp.]|nr:TolC family protein [Fibrobacter sp.]
MTRILAICLALPACALAIESISPGDSLYLDFDKALKVVISNNSDVQEAKYNWIAQAEIARGAFGEFEPHIVGRAYKEKGESPSALFTETKDEYKIGIKGKLPTGTEYDVGFNQATYTHSNYTSELYFGGELRQHLLKNGLPYFSPTSDIKIAKLEQELAYQKYRDALSEIIERFCNTYWDYYYAQQTLRFSTESARVANEIVTDAKKRLEQGLLSFLDYQKTIAEYSDREAARLDALDKMRNARLTLLLALSSKEFMQDSRPIAIHPNTQLDTSLMQDSIMLLDSISLMHPSFLAQSAEVEIQETELNQHKTDFLPTVDLVGNYGIRSRDNDARAAVSDFKRKKRRQTVLAGGVEIDIPLFANVNERHQMAAKKATIRSARVKLSLIQNKLYEEYRMFQHRAIELRNQWMLSETAVQYHEKELQEEFKKLELGKSNYHQIFDMEEDLREAQQRHLECMRSLRVIDVRLSRATGKLLQQNNLEQWKGQKLTLHEDLLKD